MKTKWFIRCLSVSIPLLMLVALALASQGVFASQGVTVNAQATAAATAAAPPASKMRWDIISVTTTNGTTTIAAGGIASASANDGSYITIKGTGTYGPGASDPVTGGGDWATFGPGNVPTGSGKYTVTAFAGFDWSPGTEPPVATWVDSIGKKADGSGGVATLRIAYANADGSAAGTGTLIISCHSVVGGIDSTVEGIIASKNYTLFYNPAHIVPGVDQGRTTFHFVH